MPRIPFSDLASAPEFRSLLLEEQQTVASNYWDEVAAERPEAAQFFTEVRDMSKSLFDLKARRSDAAPIQRRFLDAEVQDTAFMVSLGEELAAGTLTPEGRDEALRLRAAEQADHKARIDKMRELTNPEAADRVAPRLAGLEQTALAGGVFGSTPFNQRFMDATTDADSVGTSRQAYEALRSQMTEDYGLEPGEVDDLIKHRLGFQEKPVSRDALGVPHIKPEVLAQGPDAVKSAILNSDLPWREKQRMTESSDLRERMGSYYQSTLERVKQDHPELAGQLGLDTVDDPQAGYAALVSSLNQTGFSKLASGFTANILGAAEEIVPRVLAGERAGAEERRQEIRETMQPTRRAIESANQLSQEFYADQGTLWGVDMSSFGQGLGSVLSATGLGVLTGGASLPVSAARVATMGPTGLRMLNGANSVLRASPGIGLAMAQTGTSTYEQAIKSGMSEEEAGKAATLSAATEGVITGLFSLVGAGGVEAVGEQLVGTAARQAARDSAKSVARTFGEKVGKGLLGEQFEENLITAFDAATVQARIDPTMTVDDFKNQLRETALVTLAVSGPTVTAGSLRETLAEKATYEQSTDEIKLRADLNLAEASDPLRTAVRREGGIGTTVGERLRRAATQPGEANLPPAGQAAADTTEDGGAPAPGALEPVAPGGTEPVAPAPVGGEQAPAVGGAEVPGVRTGGASEPVLVPADAVNETPVRATQTGLRDTGERQTSGFSKLRKAVGANTRLQGDVFGDKIGFSTKKTGDEPGVEMTLVPDEEDPNRATLDAIITPQAERQKGAATEAMQKLTKEADAAGVTLDLDVQPQRLVPEGETPPMSAEQLKDWYRRFGFRFAEDSNRGVRLSDSELQKAWGETLPAYTGDLNTLPDDRNFSDNQTLRDVFEENPANFEEGQTYFAESVFTVQDGKLKRHRGVAADYNYRTKKFGLRRVEDVVPEPPSQVFHAGPSKFTPESVQFDKGAIGFHAGTRDQAEFVASGKTGKKQGTISEFSVQETSDDGQLQTETVTTDMPWEQPDALLAELVHQGLINPDEATTLVGTWDISDEHKNAAMAAIGKAARMFGNPEFATLDEPIGEFYTNPGTYRNREKLDQVRELLIESGVGAIRYPNDVEGTEPGESVAVLDKRMFFRTTTPTTNEEVQVEEAGGLPPVEGQPAVQGPAVQAEEGAAQRQGEGAQEVTEPPAEALPEPEPNMDEVFATLREREPTTRRINTSSPKFRELVTELKNQRAAAAAGGLAQRKADIVTQRKEIEQARIDRNKERLKRNRERAKNRPLDEHRKRIIELTKDERFPEGRNPDYEGGLREWLRERGYDASIKKKGFLDGLLGYVTPLRVDKRDRLDALRATLTPEVRELLNAIYQKPEKGKEQIPIIEAFANTTIGAAILENKLRSLKWYRDRKLPAPGEYDMLEDADIPGHIQSRVFSENGLTPDVLAKNIAVQSEKEGGSLNPSAEDIWRAVLDLADGKVTTEEDAESYYERKQQQEEDATVAFAEQQLELAGSENSQVIDITEVREGDRFTIGGVEYVAAQVEDSEGLTDSFVLKGDGPLNRTSVTSDFFAESVVPTEGSLVGVDPAEVEAFRITQNDPEFYNEAEPAPAPESAPEPAPVAQEQPAPPQAQTPEAPETPQQQAPEPVKEKPPEAKAKAEQPIDAVGTANALTDRLRAKRGLPPRFAPARLGNEQAWDAAMDRINAAPGVARKLVDELKKSLRSIDPVETAMFAHEMLVRENALDDALDAYNGNPTAENLKKVQLAETYRNEAVRTAEQIGTIEGRALQARKILIHQDFSFGRMAAMKVKAQGGKALTADQTKELVELHKQMEDVRRQLEAANAKLAEQEAQQLTLNIQVEFKNELKAAKKRGEKPLSFIERKAEEARARMAARKQQGRLNSLPVDEFLDISIIGVSYIAKGFNTIGTFTSQLVKDFGRKYLPFAGDIFAKSQELYDAAAPSSRVKPKEDILNAIDGDAPLDGKAIYQLVRHYINEDVEGATFDNVMEAVLRDLKEFYPDLDRRQLHVAYSNYGKVTQPDPAEDAKKARDYRALARLQSQLEDAQRGLAPLKTGMQRDPAVQAVRDLEKQVRDTMKRLGIKPTNENTQRKNQLDAIKTRLRNEFEDLDKAVRSGTPRPAYQSQIEYDEEAKRLKQMRDDRKADYDAIFSAPGLTQEQHLERAEKLLDRRIAEERKMLAEGVLKRIRDVKMGPWTPELRARQRELDQLKADRRERLKASKPKKPEDLKKYERDLASLERRIKEEEALLAAGLTARQKDFRMGRWSPELAEMQVRLDALRNQRRELAKSLRPKKDEAAAAYEKAVKAIEASVQRYKDILAGIAKPEAGKKYTPDAEMLALIDQRDALRDAVAEMRESDPSRREKRKQDLIRQLDRSIAEITRKIQDGDLSTKSKSDPFASDPDVARLREARDLLNKTVAEMRRNALPKRSPEEIAINRDRNMLQRKIEKLETRIRTKDYSKPVKAPKPDYAERDALLKRKKELEAQFNDDLLQAELANRSLGKKIFDNTTDVVFGVSRAMLTSFDAGAFGRQAGLVNFMRPGLALKNLPANFAFTEKAATRYETALESDPLFARAEAAKLALTTWRPGSSLSDREEVYRSRLAKKIPGVGASERAYVTYLNVVRFSYFNKLVESLPVTEQTEENMKRIASFVNTMTGRGNLGKMEAAAAALASVFFSPKYWWSRLQVLGGLVYHPLDALSGFRLGPKETVSARKIIAGEYARLIGSVGLVFSLLALAKFGFGFDDDEFEVVADPRSSDFGKIKIGNTRIDFMAGLLQNVVFISRMVTGEKVTAGGEVKAMSGPDAGFKETRLGETIRLLRTKLSPAAGSIANALDGADVVGNKFNWETEILGSYIPMSAAETYASMRELGIAPGVAAGLLGFIGYSANTYGGEEEANIEQDIMTGVFGVDQSRYEKEERETVYKLPKAKPLPSF
jgi:hypothetical protein